MRWVACPERWQEFRKEFAVEGPAAVPVYPLALRLKNTVRTRLVVGRSLQQRRQRTGTRRPVKVGR